MPRSAHSLSFRLWILVISTFCSALTVPATARTVTAYCPSVTISSLLKTLDLDASNTIRVVGTCQESIYIGDFADLTITGVTADGRHAVVQGPSSNAVFWIDGSHVQLQNLTIQGGLWGVMCTNFSVCRFSGNTIQNAANNGAVLDSADATFNGDVIQNNANSGLTLWSASRARLTKLTVQGTTSGSQRPGNGIDVENHSVVTIEQVTVQGNQGAGISLVGSSRLTNRPWAGPLQVTNNNNGGIWVTEDSSADLSGASVTNNGGANAGAGVVIDGNSEAAFWGGGTFIGNQPVDVYCGALNGLAAAPQLATIGVTNCPNTY